APRKPNLGSAKSLVSKKEIQWHCRKTNGNGDAKQPNADKPNEGGILFMIPPQCLESTFETMDKVERQCHHGNDIKRNQDPVTKRELHLLIQILGLEHLDVIIYILHIVCIFFANKLRYSSFLGGQIGAIFNIRHTVVVVLPPEVAHVGHDKHQQDRS